MKTRFALPHLLASALVLVPSLLLACATNTYAAGNPCPPSSPGEVELEVNYEIENLTTPSPIRCVAPRNSPDRVGECLVAN
jgi:hypothetical protein